MVSEPQLVKGQIEKQWEETRFSTSAPTFSLGLGTVTWVNLGTGCRGLVLLLRCGLGTLSDTPDPWWSTFVMERKAGRCVWTEVLSAASRACS